MRIYELAKKHDKSSSDIIEICDKLKLGIKASASAGLSDELVAKIEKELGTKKSSPLKLAIAAAPKKAAPTKAAPLPEPKEEKKEKPKKAKKVKTAAQVRREAKIKKRKEREAEKKRLEKELRLKEDFTAMLVHDLRSPLTAIIGYSDMLNEIILI